MTIIKDRDTRGAYKLIGEVLFYAPLYSDNTVDEERWERVEPDLTPYHLDIVDKLSSMNQISLSMNKGIWDETLG